MMSQNDLCVFKRLNLYDHKMFCFLKIYLPLTKCKLDYESNLQYVVNLFPI